MHGVLPHADKKPCPSHGSENNNSVPRTRQGCAAGSGVLLVVVVLIVSGLLGQVVSDALDPDAVARPTASEVAIRNFWLGHKVMRNFFSPTRTLDIQGGDYGGFTALSASEAVQSGTAVGIISTPEKLADTEDDSSAALSFAVPPVTSPPHLTNLLVVTAEPASSPSELSNIGGVPPVPPASAREELSGSMPKAEISGVQGGSVGDGLSKNRTNGALKEEDGKKNGLTSKGKDRFGKSPPGKPPSGKKAEKHTKTNATSGQEANRAPGVVSSASPPVSPLAEGDIPIFGDWDQPIPWTSPYLTDVEINMADEPLCKGVVSVHPPHPNAR